jgi:hypothetical protein
LEGILRGRNRRSRSLTDRFSLMSRRAVKFWAQADLEQDEVDEHGDEPYVILSF